jgi:TonB family protein
MDRQRVLNRLAVSLAVGFLSVGVRPATAQGPEHRTGQPWEVTYQLGEWQRDYEKIVADLKENTPTSNSRAKKHALTRYHDVLDHAMRGQDFYPVAGRFLTAMAIAEVRLGELDASAWHWQMAQNISAEFRNQQFDDFPDAAPFFKETLLPARRYVEDLARFFDGAWGAVLEGCRFRISPPLVKTKVEPRYPLGLSHHHIGGFTRVTVVIDTKGRTREPIVDTGSGFVSLDLAAMDALKDWVYVPAMCGDKLLPTYLTVNCGFSGHR